MPTEIGLPSPLDSTLSPGGQWSASILLQARGPRGLGASAEEAALYFIVGGLLMLALVMMLLILRSFFPGGPPPALRAREPASNRLKDTASRPLEPRPDEPRPIQLDPEGVKLGTKIGTEVKAKTVDDVLDWIVDQGAGDPRILNLGNNRMRLRLDDCKECRGRKGGAPGSRPNHGCAHVAGLLKGAFENLYRANLGRFWARKDKVSVAEVRCRLQGLPSCEYEVRW